MAKIIALDTLPTYYFDKENSYFGVVAEDHFISISVCQILPGQEQEQHYHERPENGDEFLIIYSGKYEIIIDIESRIYDSAQDGVIMVMVDPLERARIKNLDERHPVNFLNIFTPPFQKGELKF